MADVTPAHHFPICSYPARMGPPSTDRYELTVRRCGLSPCIGTPTNHGTVGSYATRVKCPGTNVGQLLLNRRHVPEIALAPADNGAVDSKTTGLIRTDTDECELSHRWCARAYNFATHSRQRSRRFGARVKGTGADGDDLPSGGDDSPYSSLPQQTTAPSLFSPV